jgi:hypothetical protein
VKLPGAWLCSLKGCDRLAQGNALGRERRRAFAGCNSNGKIG